MKLRSSIGSIATLVLFAPAIVHAQEFMKRVGEGVQSVASPAGFQAGPTLPEIIGNVIGALLSLVGVILLVMLIYAGFLWMTAGGEKTKVEIAQKMIRNAVIGLIIIAVSYALSAFVLSSIAEATTGGGGQ